MLNGGMALVGRSKNNFAARMAAAAAAKMKSVAADAAAAAENVKKKMAAAVQKGTAPPRVRVQLESLLPAAPPVIWRLRLHLGI